MIWTDAQEEKPREGQKVLMKIAFQRFCGGTHCEDDIVITGGIKDGDWYAGNDMLLWDYDFNLGFNAEDVIEWVSLDDLLRGGRK
jgi:hypothetical protein